MRVALQASYELTPTAFESKLNEEISPLNPDTRMCKGSNMKVIGNVVFAPLQFRRHQLCSHSRTG